MRCTWPAPSTERKQVGYDVNHSPPLVIHPEYMLDIPTTIRVKPEGECWFMRFLRWITPNMYPFGFTECEDLDEYTLLQLTIYGKVPLKILHALGDKGNKVIDEYNDINLNRR